ncbi:Metallopeptidase family M24 [Andreprevotia lacus DSM 23236]|jgi:Xaa-Pro aminopeptidase|uniref:Metallopeptidase family M24 n=1 Tax=Andreprevotia lacus DSM 23236 TaxID=1121001 RepID=A0A1W1WWV7_9NEIS|nr:M24 family metallopeptidase [Andreprevotia lacus]SMC16226.1 Metallopeptidase family M24 [Andreprevotia lacus DSM 23236]
MPDTALIAAHRHVQDIAKAVLAALPAHITPDDSEYSITQTAYRLLCELGAPDTWYYNCPAFVLAGERSCLSISGRDYEASRTLLGHYNLITVDLSPSIDGHWGDCARSFYLENGRISAAPTDPQLQAGQRFLTGLHAAMRHFVTPDTRCSELFDWSAAQIAAAGFENLDFLGNVGHSIATRREDRTFIERGKGTRLGELPFFTYEPHVRQQDGRWGFKHENIFYFDHANQLVEL